MKEITITTQKEFDGLPDRFDEFTRIYIKAAERITVDKARGNSSVVARENSSVEARENSSVEARENSSVEARENSSVEARDRASTQVFSDSSIILLFSFAVAIVAKNLKAKITKKSKTAYIHEVEFVNDFFEREGIDIKKGKVILFKKVSNDFKTQENSKNETLWEVGSTVTHKDWKPESGECGEGKFHACSRPYFCDEFRSNKGDKYIAIEVTVKDTHQWKNPDYPHKIAFRECKVLHECDRMGKEMK